MPFVHGNVTAQRLMADKRTFDENHIAALMKFDFTATPTDADGVTFGWCAGDHELDAHFACEKNLRGEFLSFALRVSQDKLPASRLKALYHQELAGVVEPGQKPTAKQKREAKESARDQVEQEAKDGRYRKHKVIPVVWDGETGEVWFGATGAAHLDRFCQLFHETFSVAPNVVSAGSQYAGELEPAFTDDVPAWIADEESLDWLGNEFALWLLWKSGTGQDEIGGVTVMPAKTLVLGCPVNQGGQDVFTHEAPVRLPEVVRALQAGKLPRKLGLSLADGGERFDLVLQAEMWTVSGGKVEEDEDTSDVAVKEANRLRAVRRMFGTLDKLYATFLAIRQDEYRWAEDRDGITAWKGQQTEVGV